MNREILFRGKSISTRNWTYGFFLGPDSIFSEYYDQSTGSWDVDEVSIDPATLNQYTGLQDKNGVRIFEGDILRVEHDGNIGESFVVWDYDGWKLNSWTPLSAYPFFHQVDFSQVIGNIHDNPELL